MGMRGFGRAGFVARLLIKRSRFSRFGQGELFDRECIENRVGTGQVEKYYPDQ